VPYLTAGAQASAADRERVAHSLGRAFDGADGLLSRTNEFGRAGRLFWCRWGKAGRMKTAGGQRTAERVGARL
jgi:hypothetical protein